MSANSWAWTEDGIRAAMGLPLKQQETAMTPDTRGDGVEAVAWRRAVEPLNKYMDGWEVTTQPGYSTSWEPLYDASALTRERAAGFAEGLAEGMERAAKVMEDEAHDLYQIRADYIEGKNLGTPELRKAMAGQFRERAEAVAGMAEHIRSLIQPQDKQETRDGHRD